MIIPATSQTGIKENIYIYIYIYIYVYEETLEFKRCQLTNNFITKQTDNPSTLNKFQLTRFFNEREKNVAKCVHCNRFRESSIINFA